LSATGWEGVKIWDTCSISKIIFSRIEDVLEGNGLILSPHFKIFFRRALLLNNGGHFASGGGVHLSKGIGSLTAQNGQYISSRAQIIIPVVKITVWCE